MKYIKKNELSNYQRLKIIKQLGYDGRGKKRIDNFKSINDVKDNEDMDTLLISMYNLAVLQVKKELKKKKQVVLKKIETKFTFTHSNIKKIDIDETIETLFLEMNKLKLLNKLYVIRVEYYDNNKKIYEGEIDDINYYTIEMNTTNLSQLMYNRLKWLLVSTTDKPKKPYTFLQKFNKGKVIISIKALDEHKQLEEIKQTYKLNDSRICVYNAFINYFTNLSVKNKFALSNLNKLVKHYDTYAKAYTDETLKDIGEFYNTTIVIRDLINGKDKYFNKGTNNRFRIELINTKLDHLDLLIDCNKNITEVETKEEYNKIKASSNFYIEEYSKLITTDAVYAIKPTNFQLVHSEWKKQIHYDTEFIRTDSNEYKLIETYDYALHTFFNKNMDTDDMRLDDEDDDDLIIDESVYKEMDLKGAYFNYPFYKGYVGIPSGAFINVKCDDKFNYKSLNNMVGFFQIKILNSNLDARLGFKNGSIHTLFSATIDLLLNNGVEMEFLNASYAPRIDIPFTTDMLETENKLKHYCKAYGIMLCNQKDTCTRIKPLDEDLHFYKTIVSDKVSMYINNGLVDLIKHKPFHKSYIHFAYAIHAYCRTQILEEMINLNMDDVFGVKVDSLVIKKTNNHIFPNTYKEKDCNLLGMKLKKGSTLFRPYFMNTFINVNFQCKWLLDNYINERVVFLGGAGGTGKTHTLLSNLPKESVVFSSYCWDLIQDKAKNYGVIPSTTHMLIGENCEIIDNKCMRHIIIDELTLVGKNVVEKIIKTYPSSFVYLVGDIDYDGVYYQCAVGCEVIKPSQLKCQYVYFSKTYRFNECLNNILQEMRKIMKLDILSYDKIEQLKEIVYKYFRDNTGNYEEGDIGIASTKNKCKELTAYFLENGAKPTYYIMKTDKNRQLYKGAKGDETNGECSLFKTIHSFQGRQISMTEKIFISMNKLYYDTNLLYTAISRARNEKQIILIDDEIND